MKKIVKFFIVAFKIVTTIAFIGLCFKEMPTRWSVEIDLGPARTLELLTSVGAFIGTGVLTVLIDENTNIFKRKKKD